jgi:hypothetical protein
LNLALLLHAQHQRVLGWVQIQSDDVGEFFHKLRVARQLEAFDPMGLYVVAAPDVAAQPSPGNSNESSPWAWPARSHRPLP